MLIEINFPIGLEMTKKEQPPSTELREWRRGTWQRLVRWVGVGVLVALHTGIIMTSYYSHATLGRPLSMKEFILYLLVIAMTCVLLPQVAFEVDYLRDEGDEFLVRNLALSFKEKWSEIKWFYNRPFLKFAILKGKKFIYFLNKTDLPDFDRLVERIREKAPQLPE